MEAYHISGGTPLRGTVQIQGAKNSVLPILAATLTVGQPCVLENCPDISDVDTAIEILRHLGCHVRRENTTLLIDSSGADGFAIPYGLMRKMRAAVMFLGALSARFGKAELYLPGGCPLGARPIDLHLRGLRHMGAEITQEGERIFCEAEHLQGCTIALPIPSVGATENLILAAIAAKGTVTVCNAAREPEIGDLIGFLRACGAEISGDGTSVLHITGGRKLHGAHYRVMPDRIVAATYLAAAAATGGEICLERVRPEHLQAVTAVLQRAGCDIVTQEDRIQLHAGKLSGTGVIRTAPYDGFPTDAQAPVMAVLALADGLTIFDETVFENRFQHVPALTAMGANIQVTKRYAIVQGVRELHGRQMEATDLRGGAALVIAALAAHGESVITKIEHIERGYADLIPLLRSCGARIERSTNDGTK